MSYSQQQQGYPGYSGAPQGSYPPTYPPNPAYSQQQQQYQPQPSSSQQPFQQPYYPSQQARPPYPLPQGGSNYTAQQQNQQAQAAIAMAAHARQAQAQQGQGMMGPPSTIPGLGGLGGLQNITRDQQQAALNMMQAQQAAIAAQQAQALNQLDNHQSSVPDKKKKRSRAAPMPAQQMISRPPPPPRHSESYRQSALSGPNEREPWADGLDEVDPRELAMGRFRSRQETLSEIFSADTIKNILAVKYDPWSGLGTDVETLEDKVNALERENEVNGGRLDNDIEAFRKRLLDAEGEASESMAVGV